MQFDRAIRTCLECKHLYRTGAITLAVGSWLTLFNHLDALLSGAFDDWLAVKLLLNYLTPFVVANLGVLSHQEF